MSATITRLRAQTVTDPYSGANTQQSWANPQRMALDGCAFAPSSTTETVDVNSDTVRTTITLFAPFNADITANDRIEDADGTVWAVDGDPQRYQSPLTGWAPGAVFQLRKL